MLLVRAFFKKCFALDMERNRAAVGFDCAGIDPHPVMAFQDGSRQRIDCTSYDNDAFRYLPFPSNLLFRIVVLYCQEDVMSNYALGKWLAYSLTLMSSHLQTSTNATIGGVVYTSPNPKCLYSRSRSS